MSELIARYTKLVMQHPENELARFSLGKAQFDAGLFAAAREQFQIVMTKKPDWMVAHILRGRCELSLGNRGDAKKAFLRARDLAREQHHEAPLSEMEDLLAELG